VSGALDWLDPHVEKYILADDGEEIRDQVRRHWAASVFPAIRVALGLVLFSTAWLFATWWFGVILVAGLVLIANGLWRLTEQYRDRFVVTNQKVYRVHGNFNQVRASMPLTRILDITVDRPLVGRIFGYGHFTFESAAQDQGLRDIRWVPDIDEREHLIQKVIHDAGLGTRARARVSHEDDGT
jgi:membrane protein YdbS with pleckstrin-like domain